MTTVAPAAAKTAPRVSVRSRDRALSLLSGVFGSSIGDMWSEYLCSGDVPYPTMAESTATQHPLWACCDILPHPLRR